MAVQFVRMREDEIPAIMEETRDKLDEIYRREILMTALGHLKARERKVIYLRFWKGKTLKKIGEEDMGVTAERIRQIEAKALRRLRSPEFTNILKVVRGIDG